MSSTSRQWLLCLLLFTVPALTQEHPSIAINAAEALEIREALGQYPLLDKTFASYRSAVDAVLDNPIELPPPGEAGGYSHERHKQNYREMHRAGLLYAITGESRYAAFVKKMLDGYAELYPTLGPHPRSLNQKPGRLFHQTLNEEVWLVNVAQAFDCVYNWLTPEDRARYTETIFHPLMNLFAVDYAEEFDRIHNHGTWAVAAVGMMAYALDEPEWIEKCLYGTQRNGEGGFLNQLDLLFSPDGYYMEGPYYIRYALRPFFLFADAVERREPERKIYAYRDQILKKAYYATARTIFPNGVFPPINDASKSMDIADIGPVIANDLTYYRYGADDNLLAIAALQDQILLNAAGLKIAKAFGDGSAVPPLSWKSMELTDGHDGKQGGLGILRSGSGPDQSMLLMKYGVHGKGHGHFDKLSFIFYDQHREVAPDYGFARWINMEPKFGGRYTQENGTYAKQTIAHNTVVVDGRSQHNGNRRAADKSWATRHFFDGKGGTVQAMSARADQQNPGVEMQRTMLLVNDERLEYPFVIDLFRVVSEAEHQYDYTLHHGGHYVTSNQQLNVHGDTQGLLGKDNGYQHIWKTAESDVGQGLQFTWIDGQRYYSLVSAAAPGLKLLMGRIGANDPDANLRPEPLLLLRQRAKTHLFASVIIPHGYFNEARETSRDARSPILSVSVIGHNEQASVVEITGANDLKWRVMVNNGEPSDRAEHAVRFAGQAYKWTGNFQLELTTN